jgi:hypothetical protein
MGIDGIENLFGNDFPIGEDRDHDATDVPAALERSTQDGSGFDSEDELDPSDFDEEADK